MKQVKLKWPDLLNVFLWSQYPKESMVSDDIAYVALLRVKEYVEYALVVLENETPIEGGEK